MPILELDNLSKSYGSTTALKGLTLSVDGSDSGGQASYGDTESAPTSVVGPLPVLVGWATGRARPDHPSLRWRRGTPAEAPRWL